MIEYKEGVATIRLDIKVRELDSGDRMELWDAIIQKIDSILSDHGRVRMTKEIMDKYYDTKSKG